MGTQGSRAADTQGPYGHTLAQAFQFIDDALKNYEASHRGPALSVFSPPRSGKTSLAIDAAVHALGTAAASDRASSGSAAGSRGASGERAGNAGEMRTGTRGITVTPGLANAVALVAPTARQAKAYNNRLLDAIQVTAKPRIAQTINALAFQVLAAVRAKRGETPPDYLDAADQDSLLHGILDRHKQHARSGESAECATCMKLVDFLRESTYEDSAHEELGAAHKVHEAHGMAAAAETTESLFDRQLGDRFVDELRSMFARMNEVGARHGLEDRILSLAGNGPHLRLRYAWSVAFALRGEYAAAVSSLNQARGKFNVDSSYLLIQAQRSLADYAADGLAGTIRHDLPRIVIVDDYQEVTLAGAAFLQQLQECGTGLIVVMCPDEAAQTFRGSYPEYLAQRAQEDPRSHGGQGLVPASLGRLGARQLVLPQPESAGRNARDEVCSRISMSITSQVEFEEAVGARPWKLGAGQGAGTQPRQDDGSITAVYYGSPQEETAAVVRSIMGAHLSDARIPYDDMAIIAHDSSTLAAYAAALREQGIAARMRQIGTPLGESRAVHGLFDFIELSQVSCTDMQDFFAVSSLSEVSGAVYRLISDYMDSPYGQDSTGTHVHAGSVAAALQAVSTMANFIRSQPSTEAGSGILGQLAAHAQAYASLSDRAMPERLSRRREGSYSSAAYAEKEASPDVTPQLIVLDLLACSHTGDSRYSALLEGFILSASSLTARKDVQIFIDIIRRVRKHAGKKHASPADTLMDAWTAIGLSELWEKQATNGPSESVKAQANDQLDTVIRLFTEASSYADGSSDIGGFMRYIRTQDIATDSLSKKAPVENAVTLATPAAAAGQSWKYVWIPQVLNGVWPNMALRDRIFAADDLTDIMLTGRIRSSDSGHNARSIAILQNEKKSFLIALTRAERCAAVSSVRSDTQEPSDFFDAYMPDIVSQADGHAPAGSTDKNGQLQQQGVSGAVSASEIIARARSIISGELSRQLNALPETERPMWEASYDSLSQEARDAVDALALLYKNSKTGPSSVSGWDAAGCSDPSRWAFFYGGIKDGANADDTDDTDTAAPGPVPGDGSFRAQDRDRPGPLPVSLSPSAADMAWGCPICYLFDRRLSGPSAPSPAADYGTLIHKVLQTAAEQKLDMEYGERYRDADAEIQQDVLSGLTDALMEIYRREKTDIDTEHITQDVYRALRNDASAQAVLQNAAFYLLESQVPGYGQRETSSKKSADFRPVIGHLTEAESEKAFSAHFTMEDIRYAYNRIPGTEPVSKRVFFDLMQMLAGGFPKGVTMDMFYRCVISLHGSIDRLETREASAGGETKVYKRIIDYKTGRSLHAKKTFNDLQLVCYQLGLIFEDRHGAGRVTESDYARSAFSRTDSDREEILRNAPQISQADLFTVVLSALPAAYGNAVMRDDGAIDIAATRNNNKFYPEIYYQPPLFDDGCIAYRIGEQEKQTGTKAHPGTTVFTITGGPPRPFHKGWTTFLDSAQPIALPDKKPDSIPEKQWQRITGDAPVSWDAAADSSAAGQRGKEHPLSHGPSTLWALSMISRVFYVASISLVDRVDMGQHQPTSDHMRFCAYKDSSVGHQDLCPACSGYVSTVIQPADNAVRARSETDTGEAGNE